MFPFGSSGLSALRSWGGAALARMAAYLRRLGVATAAAGRDANLPPARGGSAANPDAEEGEAVETHEKLDDDDEEGHDGRRHAGDRVARGTVAIPFLAGGGGAGSGKHGDEESEPVRS